MMTSSWARWAPVVLVCLFIAYQRGLLRLPASSKEVRAASDQIHALAGPHELNCRREGRTKCVVVYVAPWCPACKQFLTELFPVMLEEMKAFPHAGLEVVVGADRDSAIKTMGLSLGRPYVPDPKRHLFEGLGMRVFPSFAGISREGELLEISDGFRAQGASAQEAVAGFVKDLLKE